MLYSDFREQQKNRELDIVTGFQLLDGEMHLFVLEGLRNGAIQLLWEDLPRPENSGTTYIARPGKKIGTNIKKE